MKSGFFGMQQFSFNPAPLKNNKNNLLFYKGMSFTLRQIRINGNLNPRARDSMINPICLRVNDISL